MTDHGSGSEGPGDIPEVRERWLLVAVAGVLSFVAMLDMNIVNVAVADISAGLGVPAGTAQWAVLGYQLPVVALLLPAGRRLDGADTRTALLLATGGFALCSALAAVSPWMSWLVAARIAQGACGAVLFVLMPVLAVRSVRPELRGRAMSVPATLGPLGAVTGPAVGGLLLDHLGWRWIFLVKVPFCLLVVLVVAALVPRGGTAGARVPAPRPADRTSTAGRRALADAVLVAAGVALLLLSLTLAADTSAWLALAPAAAVPLWWWLRGPGGRPVAGVLRAAGLLRTHGAVLALAAGFAAAHYVIALHLRRDEGVSATATGLAVLAFPLGMGVAGPLGGRLADRYGSRPVALTGAALTAVGLLLLVPLGDGWSPAGVAWRLAVAGFGMGLNGGPVQALVMGAAPPDRAATVGSTVQLARSLGFTLGPALATAAWGLTGPDGGARAALAVSATAAALAVPLLALPSRRPASPSGETTDATPAAPR
ncbi:MFS transporter [Streptomyces sp. NPDC001834]|uniref:MFS transporter n=1 Tax=unclassified Streptomyces TaxID=2593676 RepID=UPI003446C604